MSLSQNLILLKNNQGTYQQLFAEAALVANDVKTITLSYTFYRTLDDVPDEAPEIVSDADAGIGPKLTLTTAHLGGS